VKRKAAGHTIEAKPAEEDRSNVIDLMDALKQSMGKRAPARRTARKSTTKGSKRKAG
jgi:DNA end-binding protein Ku